MSILDWAKREVDIACKKENPDRKDGEFDYGCACYESALKAFKSLVEDDHSGFSIMFTKHILNRLIDGKPLTQIEDTEDIWGHIFDNDDGTRAYQCKRMRSLFRYIHPDGTVTYSDANRFRCVNIKSNICFSSGYISKIMTDIVEPISMPYMPADKPYYVYCDDFLFDPKNGDFDTVCLMYYVTPEGEKHDLNIYLADNGNEMVRISKDEYEERKAASEKEAVINENN